MRAFKLRIVYIYFPCIFSVLVSLPPEVLGAINSFIRNVGQDVVFKWDRTSGSIDEVRWGLVDDKQITLQFIYVESYTNVAVYSSALNTPAGSSYKGRVHYVGDVPAGRAWFKITNLSISDTNDKYGITIIPGPVNTVYKMSLTVAATPKFQPQPPLTKTVAEGQDLSVPCTAVGPPTPNVTWVQIAGDLTKSTGTGSATLRIPNIRRDQNGTYECQARNNPNERPVTAQTAVTVYYPPQDILTSASSTAVQGNVIVLSCSADGYPQPSISWTKADGVIKAGHTVAGGTLRIPDAIKTDAGKYICTAKNTYDSREHTGNATATVLVKSLPGHATIAITETEASSITVKLTKPADDGGSPVTGYLLEVSTKPPVITVNTHAVITGLKANTLYTVNVYARNAVGYGVVSSKVTRTKKIGKPAVPDLSTAWLQATGSNLSVVLRWVEPDDNCGNIIRYTIYMKEVARKAEWTKYDDVTNPNPLEYRITDNIVYGKTYMFMVTAWNEYGESVKDEEGAKTLNTTATKAASTTGIKCGTEKDSKSYSTVLGVILVILVLSLGFNVLHVLYLRRRRNRPCSRKQSPTQKRKTPKKASAGEIYENNHKAEDATASTVTASHTQQPVQTGPEYEPIQQANPKEAASSSDDTSNYQGLNLLPNTSIQGTHGPVYEPLRTRSVESSMQHNDNEQHPYQSLDIRNSNPTYQSLQTNSRESAI